LVTIFVTVISPYLSQQARMSQIKHFHFYSCFKCYGSTAYFSISHSIQCFYSWWRTSAHVSFNESAAHAGPELSASIIFDRHNSFRSNIITFFRICLESRTWLCWGAIKKLRSHMLRPYFLHDKLADANIRLMCIYWYSNGHAF
jgi:hypothetical protein